MTIPIDDLKLGKQPKRTDSRTLKATRYLANVPPPPPSADYLSKLKTIPVFLNNKLACCTIASSAHQICAWTQYAKNQEVIIPDSAILKAYGDVSGYNPQDPSTDQGADMLAVAKYKRKVGIGGHKIGAFVEVDMTNETEVKQVIWLFGGIWVGVELPNSAKAEVGKTWRYHPNSQPGGWGGHAITIFQYLRSGLKCATWGIVQAMTYGFIRAYSDEGYAIISSDFLNGNIAPNGFNVSQLQADLAAL